MGKQRKISGKIFEFGWFTSARQCAIWKSLLGESSCVHIQRLMGPKPGLE